MQKTKIDKLQGLVIDLKEELYVVNDQLSLLKRELKALKQKLKEVETFEGRIRNYPEFLEIAKVVLMNVSTK